MTSIGYDRDYEYGELHGEVFRQPRGWREGDPSPERMAGYVRVTTAENFEQARRNGLFPGFMRRLCMTCGVPKHGERHFCYTRDLENADLKRIDAHNTTMLANVSDEARARITRPWPCEACERVLCEHDEYFGPSEDGVRICADCGKAGGA